jgi:flagellar protein FlaJ
MKNRKIQQRVKRFFKSLKERLKPKVSRETFIFALKKPHSLAYQLIGEKTDRVLPFFEDLDLNLQKAGLKVNFKAYLSLTFFASILISFAALIFIPCLLAFAFNIPFFPAVLFGVGGGLFAVAFSIIGFYFYPIYRADKLKREVEDELPFTTGYMAILASAGVSPEKIFYSISNLSLPLTVSEEAKNIVRDVNLFGLDIISALEKTSKRTPSERFREMLEGFISTIHSGGNLAAYLREKSGQYMNLKRISLHKFSDTLSVLSEFYVSLLITGPLLMVIMLAVMAMLGGGNLGGLGPDLLLNLLTYLGIPLGSVIFLIILDAVSPKW